MNSPSASTLPPPPPLLLPDSKSRGDTCDVAPCSASPTPTPQPSTQCRYACTPVLVGVGETPLRAALMCRNGICYSDDVGGIDNFANVNANSKSILEKAMKMQGSEVSLTRKYKYTPIALNIFRIGSDAMKSVEVSFLNFYILPHVHNYMKMLTS